MNYWSKLIKIIICFVLISSVLSSVVIAQKIDNRTSELENKKLELELYKLTYEHQFFKLTFWIQTFGVLLGSLAVLWTVFYGFRTISESNKERSIAKISTLLKSLSSGSEYERLAAARGLTPYIDKTTDEMLTAIAIEKSDNVRMAMETALFKVKNDNMNKVIEIVFFSVKKNTMKKVIESNSETLRKRSYLYGRLMECGVKKEQIEARCRLSTESIKMLVNKFHIDREYGVRIQRLLMDRNKKIECNDNDLNESSDKFLFNELKMTSQLAESTGRVIAKWIVEKHKVVWPETGLDLSETNLYKADFENTKIFYSIFSFCIMRHSNLKGSKLDNSIFSYADLFDSCLDSSNIQSTNLNNCILRKSSGKEVNISKSCLNGAVFSEGTYNDAKFISSNGKEVKFKGTDLRNAIFNKCALIKSEFQNANLEGATLDESKMYSSNFIGCNFNNTSIKDVFFNGADLRDTKFLNADIQDTDFRGANIKNADFRGATVKNSNFENCDVDKAIFDSNFNQL